MALSGIVKHSHDSGVITLSDGTATPITLSARYDQADFSISGLGVLKEVTQYVSRGKLVSLRHTTPTYPTGSFSLMMTDFSDSTSGTILDWLARKAPFASLVSTTASLGDVFTCDVKWTVEGTAYGDAADHVIMLRDCHLMLDASEGEPNSITVNFTCYGDVEIGSAVVFFAASRV